MKPPVPPVLFASGRAGRGPMIPLAMVETRAEVPFIGDQVGLFRARPMGVRRDLDRHHRARAGARPRHPPEWVIREGRRSYVRLPRAVDRAPNDIARLYR